MSICYLHYPVIHLSRLQPHCFLFLHPPYHIQLENRHSGNLMKLNRPCRRSPDIDSYPCRIRFTNNGPEEEKWEEEVKGGENRTEYLEDKCQKKKERKTNVCNCRSEREGWQSWQTASHSLSLSVFFLPLGQTSWVVFEGEQGSAIPDNSHIVFGLHLWLDVYFYMNTRRLVIPTSEAGISLTHYDLEWYTDKQQKNIVVCVIDR